MVKTGQIWERKDGRQVRITNERSGTAGRKYELTPLGKGRKSWKWGLALMNELKRVC